MEPRPSLPVRLGTHRSPTAGVGLTGAVTGTIVTRFPGIRGMFALSCSTNPVLPTLSQVTSCWSGYPVVHSQSSRCPSANSSEEPSQRTCRHRQNQRPHPLVRDVDPSCPRENARRCEARRTSPGSLVDRRAGDQSGAEGGLRARRGGCYSLRGSENSPPRAGTISAGSRTVVTC